MLKNNKGEKYEKLSLNKILFFIEKINILRILEIFIKMILILKINEIV